MASEAPERIWLVPVGDDDDLAWNEAATENGGRLFGAEYLRADLASPLPPPGSEAEAAMVELALKAAVESAGWPSAGENQLSYGVGELTARGEAEYARRFVLAALRAALRAALSPARKEGSDDGE
ncbi:hypothetical protein [Amaricoccus solimangrovi]|uniref:Uncharacterized protein n=1 Tax=Amaricoccus solimangrovi TaxID=2589815 RepID=A0A501WZA2_9RHOB|nr:hypothetical protein [Amaricoccus solimangrovi]TPE53047.1 hypothetical protein FJM51_03205 [Amaricoccus solimangrovi]